MLPKGGDSEYVLCSSRLEGHPITTRPHAEYLPRAEYTPVHIPIHIDFMLSIRPSDPSITIPVRYDERAEKQFPHNNLLHE